MEPAGISRGQRGAPRDRLRITVDRPNGASGRLAQDRHRIAAAAERAVEIHPGIARREGAEDLGQHDRDVDELPTHAQVSTRRRRVPPRPAGPGRAAGKRQVFGPRTLARLGDTALPSRRLPDLKHPAEAQEHQRVGHARMRGQIVRQNDATLLVGFGRKGFGVERGGEIVMRLAEQVDLIERRGELLELAHRANPRCRDICATAAERAANLASRPPRPSPSGRRETARGWKRGPWRQACSDEVP